MSYSYTYNTFNTSRHIQDIYTQDIIDKSSHTRYIHTRHKLGKIDYPLTSSKTHQCLLFSASTLSLGMKSAIVTIRHVLQSKRMPSKMAARAVQLIHICCVFHKH